MSLGFCFVIFTICKIRIVRKFLSLLWPLNGVIDIEADFAFKEIFIQPKLYYFIENLASHPKIKGFFTVDSHELFRVH